MRALLPVLFLESACLPVLPAPYECDLQDSAEPVADTATEEVEHIGGPIEEERAHIHAELCEFSPSGVTLSEGDVQGIACYRFTSPDGGLIEGLTVTELGVPWLASHAIYLESDGEIFTDNVALDDKSQAHFGSLKFFVPPEGVEVTSTSIIGDYPGVTHIQHELTEAADVETEAELSGDFPVNGWTFPVNND